MSLLLNYGADFLAILASLGAMAYCMILSHRLDRLSRFDKGLGGAIAVMSSQVDEMKAALREAKTGSDGAGQYLADLVHQAKDISNELEMMIAACHDFAEEAISAQSLESSMELDTNIAPPAVQDPADFPTSDAYADQEGAVTPMFGSRRARITGSEDGPDEATPMFRHRALATG